MKGDDSALRARALRGETLRDVLVVDFHVHAGRWAVMHLPCDFDAIVAKMERVGVDLACVNGVTFADVREGNDFVAELVKRWPDRIVPFAALNPYSPRPMIDELRRCFDELGFVGIKVHAMVAQRPHPPFGLGTTEARWDEVWAFAAERKSVVLAHGIVGPTIARAYPDVTFVLAHGTTAGDRLEAFANLPNVFIDTAATQNTPWAVARAVATVGIDRVVWGTDAPLDDFAQRLGVVLDGPWSDADKTKILGLNAARILRRAGYKLPAHLCKLVEVGL